MFDFFRWKNLCERVCNHGRTINEPNRTLFNNPADEMKSDVNVFHSGMILVVLQEHNGGLIVRIECGGQGIQCI
jgi:hypothetical protein